MHRRSWWRRASLTVAATLAACAREVEAPHGAPAEGPLVGTWRVLDVAEGDSAAATRPFGPSPRGYVVYDATGRVHVQVRRALPGHVRGVAWAEAPRPQLLEMLTAHAASFGTYAVDTASRIVTHVIEGELPPAPGSVERATPYALRADTLVLGAGTARRWTLVRVPPR